MSETSRRLAVAAALVALAGAARVGAPADRALGPPGPLTPGIDRLHALLLEPAQLLEEPDITAQEKGLIESGEVVLYYGETTDAFGRTWSIVGDPHAWVRQETWYAIPARAEEVLTQTGKISLLSGLPAPQPLLAAGAMLAALRELNPASLNELDARNPARVRRALEREMYAGKPIQIQLPPFRKLKFALDPPAEQLGQRLQDRVSELLNAGWRAEVEGLLLDGIEPDCPAFRAIGYHCIVEWTQGKFDRAKVTELITNATRQYAKKQRTWLRAEPNIAAVIKHDIGPEHAARAATTIEQMVFGLGQHDE